MSALKGSRLKMIKPGYQIGKLTVLKFAKQNKWGGYVWLCHCDCGNDKEIAGSYLLPTCKPRPTKSCGCLRVDFCKKLPHKKDKTWTPEKRGFHIVWSTYVQGARHRNIPFLLTKEEFAKIIKESCYYCGIRPFQKARDLRTNYPDFIYNGVDRLENHLPYTKNNCVACCGNCNYAKRKMSIIDFREWIKRIYNFQFNNQLI